MSGIFEEHVVSKRLSMQGVSWNCIAVAVAAGAEGGEEGRWTGDKHRTCWLNPRFEAVVSVGSSIVILRWRRLKHWSECIVCSDRDGQW